MKKGKLSKSWKEKLEKDMEPKLVEVPEKWARRIGHGKMLVPSPLLVNDVVKKIPKSKVSTVNDIWNYLARQYKADITCPLTTGIFLNIVANAAEEDRAKGVKKVTPYWRVLKEGGSLNQKFPGGADQQRAYLQQEGFAIEEEGKPHHFFVKGYDKKLAEFI